MKQVSTTKLIIALFVVGVVLWHLDYFDEFLVMLTTYIGTEIVDRWAYDDTDDNGSTTEDKNDG